MQKLDKGRFLKKSQLEKLPMVEIEDYAWNNLGREDYLPTDNPRRSVIVKELHSEKDLEKIGVPSAFVTLFAEKTRPLFPVDLTKDYLRSQEELVFKKKRKMLDEDEAVAFELAEAMERGQHVSNTSGRWNRDGAGGGSEELNEKKQAKSESPSKSTEGVTPSSVEHRGNGVVIKSSSSEKVAAEAHETLTPAKAVEVPVQVSSPIPNVAELMEIRQQAQSEGYAAGLEEGRQAGAVEVEQQRAQAHQEGYNSGYEEGFRVGEQRGEISGEGKVQTTLKMLNEVVGEIDKVRAEIVSSGQDIFLEFAKVASESILRSQLTLHEGTLRSFMSQTLSPFVDRSFIAIEVAAGESKRMNELFAGMPELQSKVRVKESNSLALGDFRVEADNEVVVVDLKRAVESLLDTLKADILSDHKKENGKDNKGAA